MRSLGAGQPNDFLSCRNSGQKLLQGLEPHAAKSLPGGFFMNRFGLCSTTDCAAQRVSYLENLAYCGSAAIAAVLPGWAAAAAGDFGPPRQLRGPPASHPARPKAYPAHAI